MRQPLPLGRTRRGATLVEVLMALLVMAIGVTSVFTLFPLALLKSMKANQLTNAKLYEGSIEDMVLATPQLVTGAPPWEPRSQFAHATSAGTWPYPSCWAMKPTANGLPDSNTLYFATNPASNPPPNLTGFSDPFFASSTPNRVGGAYQIIYPPAIGTAPPSVEGTNYTWFPYRHSPLPGNWTWTSYIVDPLGFYGTSTGVADQASFGRIQALVAPANDLAPDRIHCQLSSSAADQVFKLPDSWNVVLETTNVGVTYSTATPTELTLNFPDIKHELIDRSSLSTNYRVILSSTLLGTTLSVPVLVAGAFPGNPTPQDLRLLVNPATLPAGFPAPFDQARIEVQSPSRYSWLMAVQLGPSGELEAQAAVVFNRTFEIQDEQGYEAEFCVSEDTNVNGTMDGGEDDMWPNGRLDTNLAKIRWPAAEDGPKVKEGNYILDANHARWYQITKIIKINNEERVLVDASDSVNAAGPYYRMLMQLDSPVEEPGSFDTGSSIERNTDFTDYRLFDTTGFAGSAVLIPGIVHVFPINQ